MDKSIAIIYMNAYMPRTLKSYYINKKLEKMLSLELPLFIIAPDLRNS